MRYRDFRLVEYARTTGPDDGTRGPSIAATATGPSTDGLEAGEVYVIGDSHAAAMGGSNNLAANGARLSAIARQAQRVPEGATVYMTGGHNDVPAGTSPQQIASQVQSIISSLEGKGCTVNYILFPEGSSNTNQENMAPTRQAISSAVEVAQDLDGCSMQGDGIHCSLGSYRGIVQGGTVTRSDSNDPSGTDGLEAGPPYPSEQMEAVRALQTKLEELGYPVGSTGVDGKYGPRTVRAVRAFKQDNNLGTDGMTMSAADIEKLNTAEKVENPTPTGNTSRAPDVELGDLADIENLPQAKEVVEEFLGSPVSDEDMNMLIRAVASEASRNNLERAAVAAVILNRVRENHSGYGRSIRAQLYAPAQFQAVTGTRTGPRDSEGRRTWTGPSRNYTNMSSQTAAEVIGTIIQNLGDQNRTWMNFTANNPRAYGAGTNIDFLYTMRQSPGAEVIGGTVFGTA